MLKRGATAWRRSSSCANGACVEVARDGEAVAVRNSMDGDTVVAVSGTAWTEFVEAVRAGEFDLPSKLADVNN